MSNTTDQSFKAQAFYRGALDEISQDPKFETLKTLLLRADHFREVGDLPRAEAVYAQAISQTPNHPLAYYCRALVRARRGQYREALKDGTQALKLRPVGNTKQYYVVLYLLIAELLFELGEIKPALLNCEEVLKRSPEHVECLMLQAKILLRYDPQQALVALDQLLQLQPDYSMVHYNLGIAYSQLQQSTRAIAHFSEAIRLDPLAEPYFQRANLYLQIGEVQAALADCDRALAVRRNYGEARLLRARILSNLGDYGRALVDYDEALALNPRWAEAFAYRGKAKLDVGDSLGAERDCKAALQLEPKLARGYQYLGLIHFVEGKDRAALKQLQKAIQLDPEDPEAHVHHGLVLLQSEPLQAIHSFTQAILLNPRLAEAYNYRGEAYLRLAPPLLDLAVADFSQAIAETPDYVVPYCNRGDVRVQQGNYSKAVEDYSQAIALAPNYLRAYEARSQARERLGDAQGAREDEETAGYLRLAKH